MNEKQDNDVSPEAILKLVDHAIYVQDACAKNLSKYESRVCCEHAATVLRNLKTRIVQTEANPTPPPIDWQPVETMPKSGDFLIGVWEGEWREPRQNFCVYEATGFPNGPVWGRSYRTAEGGAYEVVGWIQKPLPPKDV